MTPSPSIGQGDSDLPARRGEEAPASIARSPQKGLRRAVSALRHRNYRLFWCGQLISLIGTWMQGIGESWLVLQLSHSAFQIGVVGALQSLPILFFSLLGGVYADRWPKRRVLLCTQSLAMAQAVLIWVLLATGTIQLWHIYILALLLGLTNCLGRPTGQAFVVELVGRADLSNAVALNSSLSNLTRIVGPALGGIIIAASGVTMLFLINALSFIAPVVGLALIDSGTLHAQAGQTAKGQTTWQSLREGVDYVRATPSVAWLILVAGFVLLFGSNFNVVLPILATDVLHAGARGFGFLSAAAGVGSLIAALWLAWSYQQPTIRRVLISTLTFGVLEAALALSHLYALSLVLLASVGCAEVAFAMLAVTMLQTSTPDHLRGRVMSVCILFFEGSVLPGYLLMGWLAEQYGPSAALLSGAALSLLVVGAGWIWHLPAERSYAAKEGAGS